MNVVLFHDAVVNCEMAESTGGVNVNMESYQYRIPHYKNTTESRPSYLYIGKLYTWKDGLYIEMGPVTVSV